MNETINNTIKITNNTFAIPARADAIPKNPKTAATRANKKNIIVHPNIGNTSLFFGMMCCLT